MTKRKLSKRQRNRIQTIQQRRRERAHIKQAIDDEDLLNLTQLGAETTGLIVCNYGSHIDVEGAEAPYLGELVRCHKRANLATLVTGDRVVWRSGKPYGVVVAHEQRTSELVRPDHYGTLRPVAANIDRIAIVFAPKPKPYSNLLDRYLVAAEAQGIQPVLILNKTDLYEQQDYPDVDQLIKDYQTIGYEVLSICAKTGRGVSELQNYLADHSSIFVGQSGVGKSSLLNLLQPEANHQVGPLSASQEQGTHTTTASKLLHLSGGGILIDSPGIRTFALTHLSQQDIINAFIDFRPYLGKCKFRDCQHDKERHCALLSAVANKQVLASRLNNYRQIIQTQEH